MSRCGAEITSTNIHRHEMTHVSRQLECHTCDIRFTLAYKMRKHKIERTYQIAVMIRNCRLAQITTYTSYGWDENDGRLEIRYFDGNPFPQSVSNDSVTHNQEESNENG